MGEYKQRVNWVDGMLINKTHFKRMEDFLLSNIFDATRTLLSGHYGIVKPFTAEDDNYPWISLSIDASDNKNQKIVVAQMDFWAITPAGAVLNVNDNCFNRDEKMAPFIVNVDEQKIIHADPLYLVLLVQPFDTHGHGIAQGMDPLRFEHCSPDMELRCVSSNSDTENIVGPYHFPVAKVKIINHKLHIDHSFIPPAVFVSSHCILQKKFIAIKNSLHDFEDKIATFLECQNFDDENIEALRSIFQLIYHKLIEINTFFEDEKDFIRPSELIRTVKTITLQMKKALLCNAGAHRYFVETWNTKFGINFHNLTNELETLAKYKNYDPNQALETCLNILDNYMCKIAAITNYNKQATSPLPPPKPRPQQPGADYIL